MALAKSNSSYSISSLSLRTILSHKALKNIKLGGLGENYIAERASLVASFETEFDYAQ